jgi:hypothetical protein
MVMVDAGAHRPILFIGRQWRWPRRDISATPWILLLAYVLELEGGVLDNAVVRLLPSLVRENGVLQRLVMAVATVESAGAATWQGEKRGKESSGVPRRFREGHGAPSSLSFPLPVAGLRR